MMNVGENRAQNGVLDCPESKNEEKLLSVGRLDPSRKRRKITKCWSTGPIAVRDGEVENPPRYAMHVKYLRFLRISSRYAKPFWAPRRESSLYYQFGDTLLHLYYQVDCDSGENALHKIVVK
ncbi:hypothetical protein E3N88_00047 [Mikania micrantha]|uniref:Uncharacterized protein n=1 Tax=Mikania micrantha TaxID=192012 RepID=A0A5N6PZ00_9ASTR|nr:hypothetical protein E3N88_00047 [Mikania micrantha]